MTFQSPPLSSIKTVSSSTSLLPFSAVFVFILINPSSRISIPKAGLPTDVSRTWVVMGDGWLGGGEACRMSTTSMRETTNRKDKRDGVVERREDAEIEGGGGTQKRMIWLLLQERGGNERKTNSSQLMLQQKKNRKKKTLSAFMYFLLQLFSPYYSLLPKTRHTVYILRKSNSIVSHKY